VFDLFVQGDTSLDRARSGLGIGLALVRQIVALHGGTVTATSDGPGRGAEFTVCLPLADQGEGIAAAPPLAPAGRRLRVLVVDDQRDVADSVAALIGTFGHDVAAIYDGEAALRATRQRAPDVLVVDIGMPRMTGYELARRVRRDAALRHVRLIALTGYGREEDRSRVAEAGFDLHITKPVTDAELEAALAEIAAA
jgi:CheY-like chemotaxis protein